MNGFAATRLLRNHHLLTLAIILILVASMAAWSSLPRIEDPRITTRNATVITALPGATAERVEALVTKKLEDTLREIAEIKTIESTSRGAISVISIELDDSVDASTNEQIFSEIRDKLGDVEGKLPAGASKPNLDDKRGAVAYSLIAALSWEGSSEPRLGILDRLAQELSDRLRNLPGTEQVVRFGAVEEEIRVSVDPDELAALGLTARDVAERLAGADPKVPAGSLHTDARQVRVEVTGELDTSARVAAVPLVADERRLVSLGDVARVTKAWREPPVEMAFADGRRAILIGVRTREAVHLDAWAAKARELVDLFRDETGSGVAVDLVFDQSSYTNARLGELGANLGAGAGVVVLVVFLTMGWRAALIVGAALPLSAAVTLFGLDLAGQQIHQMSIFGMIIAIGLLIDNAIVMTDEVRTRRGEGIGTAAAAESAVRHLFPPLAASTFTTILGFMPIFLLPGNVGDFVGPIAVSVILALAASFAISMTIIPALAALLVRPAGPEIHWWRDGWSNRRLSVMYRSALTFAVQRPVRTAAACLVLPVAGFVAAGSLGNQFFPAADRDQFKVQVWLAPDTAITRTANTVLAMEEIIRNQGEVQDLTWVVGASSPPVYYNQLRDQDNNPGYARGTVLATSPATAKHLVEDLQDRLSDGFPEARVVVRAFGQGPPIPAPVSMRLVGPDTEQLRAYGEELRLLMHELPEITHTRASIQGGEPKLWLDASEEEARLAGLTLGQIAGDSEEQGEAVGLLLAYAPLLATLMLASLVLSFRSLPVAAIIGTVAVLSVGLGMLSLWSGGYPLGFNPIIGSAGLVGVAINASIVVLAAIRANPSARAGDVDEIVREALGATRHIVATTLTTIGGFLPLLLFSGGDFWPPLAIVIAGGVGLSISLGLVFTPAVYSLIARRIAATAGSSVAWA